MLLRLLTRLPVAGLGLAAAAPVHVAHRAAPAAGTAARAATEIAGAGLRTTATGASAVATGAARAARIARGVLRPATGMWSAGSRLHLSLRPRPETAARGVRGVETAAKKVAATLAEHPDVLVAYWDGGLGRLVVQLTGDAARDQVVRETTRLADAHGLDYPGEQAEERTHPGDPSPVRVSALALACDVAGIATALTARSMRLKRSPRLVTAAVTMMREDSRVRGALRRRFGTAGTDLLLAAAHAAAHGFGQSPTALALDAALRGGQLVEAVTRIAAFEAAHDTVCAPHRLSVGGAQVSRPVVRRHPGDEYADQAVAGSLVGAAATVLFTGDTGEAAEAVLAAMPKAARYGPAAFTAALGCALARHGVLVRDAERLRQLELVDAVVLHPDALRGDRRTVLEVNVSVPDWDEARLWRAASATLSGGREGPRPRDLPPLALRPVPDQGSGRTGLMIAAVDGRDVGTVLVGWELDPQAEPVLEAARRAGLHVVVVDDPSLGDFGTLADELAPADRPLTDIVRELQNHGRVVMTVARVPHDHARATRDMSAEQLRVLAGLLRSDVAVSLTDEHSAVVWGADLLALDGLEGVWRLLVAVPAARSVSSHSRVLAKAGAALSELLVITRGGRPHRTPLTLGVRLSPVNAATGGALVSGWRAAFHVAARPAPHPRPRVPWHALRPEEALARLARRPEPRPSGLSAVRSALGRGTGAVLRQPVFTPLKLSHRLFTAVRAELNDPLTPVLAVGAAASALLGSTVDALLVTGAMTMNALVGGVQRLRAEHALAALVVGQRQKARRVVDRRTGRTTTVDASKLAPGEIIEVSTGEVVPADARLLEVDGLEVDESSLTGESLPTGKQLAPTPQASVADRSSMLFEGTTVVAGRGRAVVVGTGAQTEAGRAATLASRVPPAAGVQARLQELTRKVLPLTLAGGAAVTGLSLLRRRSVREAVGGGVAVAVAAVPEGLPLVATVAQLAAARRLSEHGVLVRTPRTLEALGRVDTVCFDKTGTLTENRLHVVRVVTADGSTVPADSPRAEPVLRIAGRACPHITDETGIHAHATDEAVLAAAPADPGWSQLDAQPFEASRGYASAIGRDRTGTRLLVVKGAPEVVLPCCVDLPPGTDRLAQSLAGQGLRLLAVARRRLGAGKPPRAGAAEHTEQAGHTEQAPCELGGPLEELELAGFVALADTPRPSSAPLIADLIGAGVRPVMLTGDHPQTARAIAVQLGWPSDVAVVTGDELAALDRAGRARLLRDCGVVARVAPEQKLQVVEALQAAGRVVAMVGDGANDAAAIRAADVGIGVAVRGSAAARNAADLVLTNHELSALVDAVAEGRALWRSVADAISILIGGNAGEVGFTLVGTLLGGASPLSTRQLLLVNLLTDMFPAMAVAVTPHDHRPDSDGTAEAFGTRGTVPVGIATLGAPLIRQIRQRGAITALGAGTAWLIGRMTPGTERRTSTMAMCGVVGAQLTQTLAGRGRSPLVVATTLGSALALFALVQTPGLSHFFGCTPLGPVAWTGVAVAIAVAAIAPWLAPNAGRTLSDLAARLRPTVRVTHA